MVYGPVAQDEVVVPIDLGIDWEPNVARPCLLQGWRTFLVFYMEFEPDIIGTVEWHSCSAAVLGSPSNETFEGHRLYTRGLSKTLYRAAEVRNSGWIAAMEQANRVHPQHDPEPYSELRHFILSFHDETFECVADGWSVEEVTRPMEDVLADVAQKLIP